MLNMHKIHISRNKYMKKNMLKKCWLIHLFYNQSIATFFYHDLPVFSLILTETLAKYPLIQLSFSNSFFFEAEIYKN